MSCAKFEPQWAYEWQIRDSDWSHVEIEREPQYEEEWFSGAENVFDKV